MVVTLMQKKPTMKILITILLLLMAFGVIRAQDKPIPPRTIFKVSPQHFIVGNLQLGLERFNSTYSKSFSFSVGIISQGAGVGDRTRGIETDLQYRKYIKPVAEYTSRKGRVYTQGIYFGPFISAGYFRSTGSFNGSGPYYNPGTGTNYYNANPYTTDQRISQVAGGFTFGMQRTFWEVIILDVFVGGGMKLSTIEEISPYPYTYYYSITEPGYSGVFPRIGFKVGIGL